MYFLKNSFVIFLAALLLAGCNQNGNQKKFPILPGYDLQNPITIHLKTTLDEISGIVYYAKDTSVFAINDELGVLYKIYIRNKVEIEEWKFSNGGDYEDLALVDSTFFALHSNGSITRFRVHKSDSITEEECQLPLKGRNEFETIYFDEFYQTLVLLCKDCKADEKEIVSAYAFDPQTKEFDLNPLYTIKNKEIIRQLQGDEKKFKPSAAAIHPLTKDLFIISSINKALVITDREGKLKKVFPLNPAIFKQPEGIAFTPKGDMLISNESAEIGAGNILIFKYKL